MKNIKASIKRWLDTAPSRLEVMIWHLVLIVASVSTAFIVANLFL